MKIISQTADELILKDGGLSSYMPMIVVIVLTSVIVFFVFLSSHSGTQGALILCIFPIVEILTLLLISYIVVDFNKSGNKIIYQKKRIFGGKTFTYEIGDVVHVESRKEWELVRESAGVGRSATHARMPRLMIQTVLVFKNSSALPLGRMRPDMSASIGSIASFGSPLINTRQDKSISIANQIAGFLGVPFQEIAPPTSGMGINIGGTGIRL
ncbi:MAG: hypothetical protein ABR875_00480 [Minisyncoccia bacterium]|jgi:hypothetical protein